MKAILLCFVPAFKTEQTFTCRVKLELKEIANAGGEQRAKGRGEVHFVPAQDIWGGGWGVTRAPSPLPITRYCK